MDRLSQSHNVLCCIFYGMYFANDMILLQHIIGWPLLRYYGKLHCIVEVSFCIECYRMICYIDCVKFRMILLWHDCIPYGLAIDAAIVTI